MPLDFQHNFRQTNHFYYNLIASIEYIIIPTLLALSCQRSKRYLPISIQVVRH